MLENWGRRLLAARRRPAALAPRLARARGRGLGRSPKIDRSFRVFASERRIKFTEMEYGIPREHAAEAVRRVLAVAAIPGTPSPSRSRSASSPPMTRFSARRIRGTPRTSPSIRTAHLDWESYFREVEAVMATYDGRPHWGKRHFQTAETLAKRYPDGMPSGPSVTASIRIGNSPMPIPSASWGLRRCARARPAAPQRPAPGSDRP